ncbi:MAG: hypothetical protein QOE65_2839 [Solirubrobacteraceae bacterium]|nr:hypothetical protein [Solirubrobacteraceae bacterium]
MWPPPLLSSRPPVEQILVANVLPCVFGAVTGLVLGLHEVAYLLLAGPIGLLGGFFAGVEHRGGPEGAARGALGGLQFGALILAVHELSGMDAKADLPHPAILLVVLTTGIGMVLGFAGGLLRERQMRRTH